MGCCSSKAPGQSRGRAARSRRPHATNETADLDAAQPADENLNATTIMSRTSTVQFDDDTTGGKASRLTLLVTDPSALYDRVPTVDNPSQDTDSITQLQVGGAITGARYLQMAPELVSETSIDLDDLDPGSMTHGAYKTSGSVPSRQKTKRREDGVALTQRYGQPNYTGTYTTNDADTYSYVPMVQSTGDVGSQQAEEGALQGKSTADNTVLLGVSSPLHVTTPNILLWNLQPRLAREPAIMYI